jgi:hypothetical protein
MSLARAPRWLRIGVVVAIPILQLVPVTNPPGRVEPRRDSTTTRRGTTEPALIVPRGPEGPVPR